MWSRNPMPVFIVICWVDVNCVECGAFLSGRTPLAAAAMFSADSGAGKWSLASKGSRAPPSRESETWILVSLVMREMDAVRRDSVVMVGDMVLVVVSLCEVGVLNLMDM